MGLLNRYRDLGPLALRLMLAAILIDAGLRKFPFGTTQLLTRFGFPVPAFFAFLNSSAELFGGILLLLGLFTRWAAIPLLINFAVALALVRIPIGFRVGQTVGAAWDGLIFTAILSLLLTGPGAYSIDARRQAASASGAAARL